MAAVLSKVSHVERNKGKQKKFLLVDFDEITSTLLASPAKLEKHNTLV